jgi:hypothetical protein
MQGSFGWAGMAMTWVPRSGQLVVEAGLGLEHGFWNLVANGATFRSLGRRPTRPGCQLITADPGNAPARSPSGGAHAERWRSGQPPTPARPRAAGPRRGVGNHDARRLYKRLGYVDWGHGTVVGTWQELDHDGTPVTMSETLDTLVKGL